MITLKNIVRIEGTLFKCDLYSEDDEVGYTIYLDPSKWNESIENLPEEVLDIDAFHAMMVLRRIKPGDSYPTEFTTSWY